MAKLSADEQKAFEALQAKLEAPDEPSGNGTQRVENVNVTIDLDNEAQVKRAVKAGLLPASYLEDDEAEEEEAPELEDEAPNRKLDKRFS